MTEGPAMVAQVNSSDQGGGAALIACQLHEAATQRGLDSRLIVGRKSTQAERVVDLSSLSGRKSGWRTFWEGARRRIEGRSLPARLGSLALRGLGSPQALMARLSGHEDFYHPDSRSLIDVAESVDLIHLHNLHGGYFDLELMPALTRRAPTVLTLHDAWLLSGHCAHSLGCERWRAGCGACPDLSIYPALLRDGTAFNWTRKQRILGQSRYYLASPSAWLLRQAEHSLVAGGAIEGRVIGNGVDLDLFRPGDRVAARRALSLPQEATVAVCVAYDLRTNPFKDYVTLREAAGLLGARPGSVPIQVLIVGESGPDEHFGAVELRFLGRLESREQLALHYQAADMYLHPARAENYPSAVMEALACGCPVIASAVGGVPEQVRDLAAEPADGRATGMLVPAADAQALMAAIERLVQEPGLRRRMASDAAADARSRFGEARMIDTYLDWYDDILAAGIR
jgi:glycosyltransferase involved in cell wall biosynthesis